MKRNTHLKKGIALAVIAVFIGVSIIPSTGISTDKKSNAPTPLGDTLYVGGDGPGNYTRIQDAIDDAEDGDTIFVFSGYYTEEIEIYKSINLIGEHKDSTSIVGQGVYDHIQVVRITTDDVTIEGFTIK